MQFIKYIHISIACTYRKTEIYVCTYYECNCADNSTTKCTYENVQKICHSNIHMFVGVRVSVLGGGFICICKHLK